MILKFTGRVEKILTGSISELHIIKSGGNIIHRGRIYTGRIFIRTYNNNIC